MTELGVSIIIPVYNLATTLPETIASIYAQTYVNWEVIIVDNNSQDETLTIAKNLALQESRIQVAIEPQQGASIARNRGIKLAKFDWLLFLDADDWIAPQYLEKMTKAIALNPTLDAVHCGWVRVTPDGRCSSDKHGPHKSDIFEILSRYCTFPPHACVIRKTKVEEVGGFEVLPCCQDWDFWQRIARSGAKFAAIPDVMAFYRMRPGSISKSGTQCFLNAMRIVTLAYRPDPRVSNPLPAYANGLKTKDIQTKKLIVSAWFGGLLIAFGQNASEMMKLIEDNSDSNLNPYIIANSLFESISVAQCKLPSDWYQIWPQLENLITDFLGTLEKQSGTVALATRTRRILERLILENTENQEEITIGNTHAIKIEITAPIPDIYPPTQTDRLHCWITMSNTRLGSLELPITNGVVKSWVIKAAIPTKFVWVTLQKILIQKLKFFYHYIRFKKYSNL